MNDKKDQNEIDLQSISEIDLIKRITKSFKNKNDSTILDIRSTSLIF